MHKDEERCLIGLISGMQQSAFCRLRAIFSGTFCTRLHIAALTAAMGNIKIVRALEHANEIAVRSVLLYQVAQLVRLGGFLNDKDNAAERLGVITHANELARQHLDKRTHQRRLAHPRQERNGRDRLLRLAQHQADSISEQLALPR